MPIVTAVIALWVPQADLVPEDQTEGARQVLGSMIDVLSDQAEEDGFVVAVRDLPAEGEHDGLSGFFRVDSWDAVQGAVLGVNDDLVDNIRDLIEGPDRLLVPAPPFPGLSID